MVPTPKRRWSWAAWGTTPPCAPLRAPGGPPGGQTSTALCSVSWPPGGPLVRPSGCAAARLGYRARGFPCPPLVVVGQKKKEVSYKTDFEAIKRDYKYLTAEERRILEAGIQQGATPGQLLAALIRERERAGRKAALNAASDHDRRTLVGVRVPRTLADAVKQAAERDGKSTYRFLVDLLEQMCYNKPYRTGDGQP